MVILGAGVTGLAAGIKTGAPIFEAHDHPGGICHAYEKAGYHFEVGGGHWLFGGDKKTSNFVEKLSPLNNYIRNSAVFFPQKNLYVPYPLQSQLSQTVSQEAGKTDKEITFADWLEKKFGLKPCRLFFFPFNDAYTAGLYTQIAPQDDYKNPTNQSQGYNSTFAYPKKGLDDLIKNMAGRCRISYDQRVVEINAKNKLIYFADGTKIQYQSLISTLPLNQMVRLANIRLAGSPAPYNSTLVVNIGAKKGKRFPHYHWLYFPQSKSGFYRVGFYSNVAPFFQPKNKDRAALYVELSFLGGSKLPIRIINKKVVGLLKELQDYQFISKPDVVDPTWIEVAYTWSWPNSGWREKALAELQERGIYQIGRYGRWHFQGILDSIKEGLSFPLTPTK